MQGRIGELFIQNRKLNYCSMKTIAIQILSICLFVQTYHVSGQALS